MKLQLDDKHIEIDQELIKEGFNTGLENFIVQYNKIDPSIKIMIKTLLRTAVFPYIERTFNVPIRPAKEIDPLVYLLANIIQFITELLKDARVQVKTESNDSKTYSPTDFTVSIEDKSESGRQLAFNWKKR